MKRHVAYCIDLYSLSVGFDSDMLYLYLTFSPVACVKLCCQSISGRRLSLELSIATLFPSVTRPFDIPLWGQDSANDLTVLFRTVSKIVPMPLFLFPDTSSSVTWPMIRLEV